METISSKFGDSTDSNTGVFDVILAADVVYLWDTFASLWETIDFFYKKGIAASVILVSFAVRTESFTSKFVEMGCQLGYHVTEIDLSPRKTTEAVSTTDSLKLCMFKFGLQP